MDAEDSVVIALESQDAGFVEVLWELGNIYEFYSSSDLEEFKSMVDSFRPRVVLLNIDLGKSYILSMIAYIQGKLGAKTSIIAVSSNLGDEAELLRLGVNDFVVKPYSSYLVRLRIDTQLKMLNYMEEIERLSVTDKLTGLPNRRGFDLYVEPLINDAIRNKRDVALIICDIDHFKAVNDTYGHQVGDMVLRSVANRIKSLLRRDLDFVCRWGGEEFAILLYGVNKKGAYRVAEYVREHVEDFDISIDGKQDLRKTISLGVSCSIPSKTLGLKKLMDEADQALYMAKEGGRNKVC